MTPEELRETLIEIAFCALDAERTVVEFDVATTSSKVIKLRDAVRRLSEGLVPQKIIK